MVYCEFCGTQVSPQARFCRACGAPQMSPDGDPASPLPTPLVPAPRPPVGAVAGEDRAHSALRERVRSDCQEAERTRLRGFGYKPYLDKAYAERLGD
jgi:hypothetical protein